MNSVHHNEDHQQKEIKRRRRFTLRINMFFFTIFFLFSVLIVRLAFIQFVEGKELSAQESQQTMKPVYTPPIRGNIYDKNGYPIAYSKSTQSLYFRMEPGKTRETQIELATKIKEVFDKYGDPGLKPMTAADVFDAMDVGYDIDGNKKPMMNRMFEPRRIKAGLTDQEISYFMSHPEAFPGVEVVEESVRHYDPGTIAAQLVGYLKPFSVANNQKEGQYLDFYRDKTKTSDYLRTEEVGFDGLEFMYQEELRGISGKKEYPVNSLNQIIGPVQITPPKKGNNLYLTIDKDVQLTAEQAIMDHLAYMKSAEAKRLKWPAMGEQARAGYAVLMEVDTGNVIAMASMPDYDPNVWSGGISTKLYNEIQPYYQNGAIKTVYPDYTDPKEREKHPTSLVPLGSTMKPLTVLIGLNEGLFGPNDKYNDTGRFYYGKNDASSIGNSQKHAYGRIGPADAIRVSSNTFMAAMIGEPLYLRDGDRAVDIWDSYMKKFGLGTSTGSGLPNESLGIIEYRHETKSASAQSAMVQASFGQQGRYTALQLAQYTAMLANRGKRLKPQFVEKITDFDGNTVKMFEPVVLNEEKFSDKHWDVIQSGMKMVSQSNTLQQWFGHLPFKVASKTGTSQQEVRGRTAENAVYIAYAPADNPKIAVSVVVPDGGYGAWGAAPIAAKIMEAYYKYVGFDGKPAAETKEQTETETALSN
ncbi:peptidoglycan D,D-transpeptidase FtsI family protein [Paenibacillus thermotolerans]|uniref:peptidoglycan D,D-transpeptidase FtsI family protein n=1 Tax=Paenibacillus thermotolerans TaxID=3027807 RepID=UPI002368DE12|nr:MULTISPECIES: penicillin-binding transpeptidase domain-containing protein [unclassified Paenibacillus]